MNQTAAPLDTRDLIDPAILYFGTPVVLVSTVNPDGTPNLAPMSSAWWLGWSCMLGFDASSQTVANLQRSGECVLNLPSANMAGAVDRLARTTGSVEVPFHKQVMGYEHVPDKFGRSDLTPVPSLDVAPPRVLECPVQLEATVAEIHSFAEGDLKMLIPTVAVEVRIRRVHVHPDLRSGEYANRIDPHRWNPLVMSFLEYFGVTPLTQPSRLRDIDEELYVARAPEPIRTNR